MAQGRVPLAQEHAQVWNALAALLEQIDAILGNVRMGRAEFLALLEEGLSGATLGVLPDTSDALRLSPLSRAGGGAVRALFVLGCSEGLLPRDHADDGLLDETERGRARRAPACRACTAAAFLSAHERLHALRGAGAPDGAAVPVLPVHRGGGRAAALLPHFPRARDLPARRIRHRPGAHGRACPRAGRDALERLVAALRRRAEDGVLPPELPALVRAFFKERSGAACPHPRRGARRGGRRAAGPARPRALRRAARHERQPP